MVLPFLGLLAVAIPPPDALPAFTSPERIAEVLRPLGYTFVPAAEGQGMGKLTHEGMTIEMGLARTTGDPEKGTPDTYVWMVMDLELATPGEPMNGKPWIPTRSQPGAMAPEFVTHLGGMTSERAQVDLRPGATKTSIRKGLDAFWAKGRAFAKAHGVPFAPASAFDPKVTPLGDALTIDRADQESFRRAILTWGWTVPPTPGYASQGWIMPVTVDGKTVWVRQRVEGTDALPRVVDVMRLDPKPTTEDPWAARKSEKDPMPTVVYEDDGMHLLTVSGSIDLAKGLTLGELRKRIEAFAAKG